MMTTTRFFRITTAFGFALTLLAGCAAGEDTGEEDEELVAVDEAALSAAAPRRPRSGESQASFRINNPGNECVREGEIRGRVAQTCRNLGWDGAKDRHGQSRCSNVGSNPLTGDGKYRGMRFTCYR